MFIYDKSYHTVAFESSETTIHVSGIRTLKVFGEIRVENFKSLNEFPVVEKRDVTANLAPNTLQMILPVASLYFVDV